MSMIPTCPHCGDELTPIFTTGDTPQRNYYCPRCEYWISREKTTWSEKDVSFAIFNELMQIRDLLKERLTSNPDSSTAKTCPSPPPTCAPEEKHTARQTSCGQCGERNQGSGHPLGPSCCKRRKPMSRRLARSRHR